MTPKASKEASGFKSGTCARATLDMAASPYLIRRGRCGFWPLEDSGWMTRPSMAAHMMILRANPGIIGGASKDKDVGKPYHEIESIAAAKLSGTYGRGDD
jgi:hypothetical protein